MAFFKDTYCQLCERFITKEQWDKQICSSRQLHRQVNGYWSTYSPQRKMTTGDDSILEKAFWEVIFGSEVILPVSGFLETYNMIFTNTKGYFTLDDDDDDDDDDFTIKYRDNMIAQFRQD